MSAPAVKRERNVLPSCVQPLDYHLHITPNFTDFSFKGRVVICVKTSACSSGDAAAHPDVCAGDSIKAIKLNANELVLDQVEVVRTAANTREMVSAAAVVYDEPNMTATIPLATPLGPGEEAALHVDFTGCINDKLVGFYRSRYENAKGEEVFMGTTQFESVDARRAFPCWDEPAVKAVFHITITAPAHMTVLSNMHVVEQRAEAAGDVTYTFAPTPKMSTYLVAWTIGDLDAIHTTVKLPYTPEQETRISLYAPPGNAAKGQYALDLAVRVLPLYEKFFEVGYNLQKLDLVAIPDFSAGAMENWGLITFRESALLCDAATTTVEKKFIALVVAHEIAHQWFGNLVTMGWWKELWLNEAFATYMEYVAVDALVPEWGIFSEMLQREGGQAMSLDALRSSHAVEVDVCDAQEIDDIFDAISYSKGACIIRMIVEYIGEEAFQKAMSRYIAHFKYGNANTVDLWRFLGEASGQDIASIMSSWTGEQGYPYLRVTHTEDGSGVRIRQHRFLATKDAECEAVSNWSIPLLLATAGGKEIAVVVRGGGAGEGDVVPLPAGHTWVKVNSRQCAFCRVLYADNLLDQLLPALRDHTLGCLDRLGVLSDYAAFARGGFAPSPVVVSIMRVLAEREDELAVWNAMVEVEDSLRTIVTPRGEAATETFNRYCHGLYEGVMTQLGYTPRPGESENEGQLRSLIFGRLVRAEHGPTLDAARRMYAHRAETPIPQNLLKAVFSVRVREGGTEALEEVKQLADTVAELSDRHKYLSCIAAACPQAMSVSEAFDYCFSSKVRPGEVFYILVGIVSRAELLPEFAKQMRERWAQITEALPPMLAAHFPKLLAYGADAEVVADMQAFYESLSEQEKIAVGRSFQQGLEGLQTNVQWAARDADAILANL